MIIIAGVAFTMGFYTHSKSLIIGIFCVLEIDSVLHALMQLESASVVPSLSRNGRYHLRCINC